MTNDTHLEVIAEKLKQAEENFTILKEELDNAVTKEELRLTLNPILKQCNNTDECLKKLQGDWIPKWVLNKIERLEDRIKIDNIIMGAMGTVIITLIGLLIKYQLGI